MRCCIVLEAHSMRMFLCSRKNLKSLFFLSALVCSLWSDGTAVFERVAMACFALLALGASQLYS